ncbi:hypothetical protein ACWDWO_18125 [Actinopolymorpha singaporensis]|uniref:hypothetical protein n=1 Tax=Actinopolymorpha singaporensis TaxID=117157 RepID=UPI0012FD6845|nr:hypothetical protein [Actinopolymorpha singaporensis]
MGFPAGYPADLAEWERDERPVTRGFAHPWRSRGCRQRRVVLVKDTLTSLPADRGGSVGLRHCRLVWQVVFGPR